MLAIQFQRIIKVILCKEIIISNTYSESPTLHNVRICSHFWINNYIFLNLPKKKYRSYQISLQLFNYHIIKYMYFPNLSPIEKYIEFVKAIIKVIMLAIQFERRINLFIPRWNKGYSLKEIIYSNTHSESPPLHNIRMLSFLNQ